MDFHHTCTLLYRFWATKDEEPPYSHLTGGRYSFMFYQISLYSIAVLVSTYSTTTYFDGRGIHRFLFYYFKVSTNFISFDLLLDGILTVTSSHTSRLSKYSLISFCSESQSILLSLYKSFNSHSR